MINLYNMQYFFSSFLFKHSEVQYCLLEGINPFNFKLQVHEGQICQICKGLNKYLYILEKLSVGLLQLLKISTNYLDSKISSLKSVQPNKNK